jgi:hypothetical protein
VLTPSDSRAPVETPIAAVQTLYGQLLNISSAPVFRQGAWSMLGVTGTSARVWTCCSTVAHMSCRRLLAAAGMEVGARKREAPGRGELQVRATAAVAAVAARESVLMVMT